MTAFDGKLSVAEPDDTREQAKLRRKAMKEASKQRNIYGNVAAPYLSAVRTVELYEGYNDLDEIISNYDDVVNERNARHERERKEKKRPWLPVPSTESRDSSKRSSEKQNNSKKESRLGRFNCRACFVIFYSVYPCFLFTARLTAQMTAATAQTPSMSRNTGLQPRDCDSAPSEYEAVVLPT